MGEAVKTAVKAPETKKENHVSQVQKGNLYQPLSSPVEQILFLQRTAGNQAVQKLMKSGALQAKLRIGAPGDVYEQEADRVADAVMRMPEPQAVSGGTPSIQRACPKCEEENLRRQSVKEEEEEKKLRKKPVEKEGEVQAKATSGIISEVNPDLESNIQSLKGGGIPLSENERAFFEPRFGQDFSQVRVHKDADAAEAALSLNARAFTVGNDVMFGKGEYVPESTAGKKLMAHELGHVVQQSGSNRIRLEREAGQMEAMASVAKSFGGFQANNQLPVSKSVQQHIIQRKKVPTDFGEFETTKFAEADGRGVEIALKFTPDESKVDAKKIALSQSIRSTTASGTAYAIGPNQTTKMVPSGKSGAGYAIDTLEGANNPLYGENNTLGPTQDLKDTPASANTTTDPVNLGVNTNYELGYCYKEKTTDVSKKKHSAGLWDKPQAGKTKGVSKTFETVALAIEGTDKDKYYGSVKWGYKMEGTDAAPTVTKMDIEEASKGTPTANFIEPAKLWNTGKTPGTIKVTADPEATVLKGDASGTETLAKDTKLKQLATVMWGTAPAIKAEVLNTDGTGSGKIIFIKTSDVKDMGDGSATKKLPV